ncbi:Ku protein [Pseudoxanthomonas sp. UTMC 1351]|uniref:non-homologous end joining protein Ku n=1 Tax=Pseudoxanthomonas sp. UTMC 1351 TaxID=2695853 RepID=UPI0034CDDD72
MARPIWTGTLSFGLLNVPVSLMSGERKVDLHFRMLDSRDKKPVRFERVNAETGEEVPWKDIVKAYEYDKGNYVVVEEEDFRAAAPESRESVEIETFVEASDIDPRYFEKPYILVPGKKAEKGYVLLRETLESTGKIGIARVVIRTRQYLSAVMPLEDALVLILLRYPQELVDPAEHHLPSGAASTYRISAKEIEMAKQLISSMAGEWKPDDYQDEYRQRLHEIIKKRVKSKGKVAKFDDTEEAPKDATTNVVDFMALLEKSLASNKRTPAKKTRKTTKATKAKSAKKTKTTKAAKKKAG